MKIGTMPLMVAAKNSHIEVVLALIKAGAQVDKAKADGIMPLDINCLSRYPSRSPQSSRSFG